MSGKALFACSKCFSRHPYEELSSGQQLCKGCRGTFPIVKCTYCRSEFQQTSKGSTSSICKKCEQNVKQHGKPSACECCNIIAAFIGSKCQRCANSELKYGQPVTCDQCKQRCAFDRHDENKKINGKLLCWLCTCSFKRALVKAHQVEKDARSMKKRSHEKTMKDVSKKIRTEIPPKSSSGGSGMAELPEKIARQGSSGSVIGGAAVIAAPVTIDPNSSDHVIAMTQLKEQISSLQKRLAQRDRELLEKDKMMTELKSKNWDKENEMRNKLRENDRLSDIKIDILNKKIASLLKEVATLKKSNKGKNGTTASSIKDKDSLSAKDSGGSGTDSPSTN